MWTGSLGARFPVLHGLNESLRNFVLGMRGVLADAADGLVLTSFTDTKIACLSGGAPAGKPRFDRDGANSSGGVEKRVDQSDGCSYTRDEFLDFYRGAGEARWASARPPTGAEDKRKMSAILFLSEESVGGGETTIYVFDGVDGGSFRALTLSPKADTLLLFRSDRVLYDVAPTTAARYTISCHFIGHYTA